MKTKLIQLIFILIFLISFASAVCTVTFDKATYVAGETATAAMVCTEQQEKNDAYVLNWTNVTGYQVELDTGTTPATVSETFYQTYSIPSDWPNGVFLNASLSGPDGDLEGEDFANVTSTGGTNSLLITNTTIEGSLMGKVSSIQASVRDENLKSISGGLCKFSIWSNDETRMMLTKEGTIFNGIIKFDFIMDPSRFSEGTGYSTKLICYCGSTGSDTECIDTDGAAVTNSVGESGNAFTVGTWLYVNTVTDKRSYQMKNELFICANVTNVIYSKRITIPITYQVRCSAGTDSDSDLDRILIIDDSTKFDERGISPGATQMQCKRFTIPESKYLQGKESECYASTHVTVLDESNNQILSYHTTSPVFNVSSDEINILPDWEQINSTRFVSIVNLSDVKYVDYNGTGTGNLDLKIYAKETLVSSSQDFIGGVDFDEFLALVNIANVTVTNASGDSIPAYLEVLEDGSSEIELRDVDITPSGYYTITLDLKNFEERRTQALEGSRSALEGIENKTGTFHLDLSCPSQGTIGSDISCILTAYVEESQTVEKEVDFTCYITDGSNEFSSTNFNQMVTKNAVSLSRDFAVPSTFTNDQQYVVQCHADYYNLGSRRDSFYDTFTAVSTSGATGGDGETGTGGSPRSNEDKRAPITGGAISGGPLPSPEEIIDQFNPLSPNRNLAFMFVELVLLAGLITWIVSCFRKSKSHNYGSRDWNYVLRKILFGIGIFIAILAIVAAAVYGYKYFSSILSTPQTSPEIAETTTESYSLARIIWTDSLFRGLLIAAFATLLLIILFKCLNIRCEIYFGQDHASRKYHEDKKSAKLQHKLNQMILKDEIKRHESNHKTHKTLDHEKLEKQMRKRHMK